MARQLADGLWRVDCRSWDKPNVYVVDDGDYTLVDAGWPSDEETVRAGLDDVGIGWDEVDRMLLTHYDADHVGTLGRLTPDLDAPVYVHHADAPYVADERLPPWTARNGIEALNRLSYHRLDLPDLPIRRLEDGSEVGGFRVHHTPGHTPGHVTYVHEGVDAAFFGDLAYEMGGKLRTSGRITSSDVGQVEESVRTVLDRVPPFEYACGGHGRPLQDGYAHLARTVE